MAELEVTKVAEQLNHQVLYSVRLSADANRMEFPIGIQDQGSVSANEAAVLASNPRRGALWKRGVGLP